MPSIRLNLGSPRRRSSEPVSKSRRARLSLHGGCRRDWFGLPAARDLRHHSGMARDPQPGCPAVAEAVGALVARYAGVIRSAVRRVAGPRADAIADDVAQIVMTGIWRQLERAQVIDAPSAYIYKAAIRETVRAMRRESHRAESAFDDADAHASADGNPHQAVSLAELGAALEAALGALEADRQRAVRAHLSGLDVAEIMCLHGWTYQRARNLVARGMADLREALRARGMNP